MVTRINRTRSSIFYFQFSSLIQNGFTLIELLMVMAVLSAIAGIIIIQFPGIQKTGRDTQRKNDLKQYQTAIEGYANSNGDLYPNHSSATPAVSLCSDLGLGTTCAVDPFDGGNRCLNSILCRYYYQSNIARTSFVLWAALEKPQGAQFSPPTTYWTVCSNGVSGESATVTTNGVCPI